MSSVEALQPIDDRAGNLQEAFTVADTGALAELAAQNAMDFLQAQPAPATVAGTTFASRNEMFHSDTMRPGTKLPMRIYMTKTTQSETSTDDK